MYYTYHREWCLLHITLNISKELLPISSLERLLSWKTLAALENWHSQWKYSPMQRYNYALEVMSQEEVTKLFKVTAHLGFKKRGKGGEPTSSFHSCCYQALCHPPTVVWLGHLTFWDPSIFNISPIWQNHIFILPFFQRCMLHSGVLHCILHWITFPKVNNMM